MNLSFENCGVWDKATNPKLPWKVIIKGPDRSSCDGFLISQTSVLTGHILAFYKQLFFNFNPIYGQDFARFWPTILQVLEGTKVLSKFISASVRKMKIQLAPTTDLDKFRRFCKSFLSDNYEYFHRWLE